MQPNNRDEFTILNTTKEDINYILLLFEQAMELQGKNGYKVWDGIDKAALEKDIDNKLQYKILNGNDILCIFSIQHNDPFIWRERDKNDAVYLHRIVVNPKYKGQKLFEKVLNWALQFARQHKLKYVRMDTWADNERIIDYYKSFGFTFIENYKTIIQHSNNLPNPNWRWSAYAEKELEDYVRKGGGLYILHSGNNAFLHWNEYEKMIGMGWRPKTVGYALEIDSNKNIIRMGPGEGNSTSHGARFNAIIQKMNPHPINKDYPAQWKTANTEVYNFPRGAAENIAILSYAYDSTQTHRLWPIEWVVKYGKGNVYNSSMGHLWKGDIFPPAYRCIGFETTMIRVTEWLATGKVTYPVPKNFPTKDSISLRNESDFLNASK